MNHRKINPGDQFFIYLKQIKLEFMLQFHEIKPNKTLSLHHLQEYTISLGRHYLSSFKFYERILSLNE